MATEPQRAERRRRVCVAITARASYSRIRTALRAIEAHPQLDLSIITAASAVLSRYGNVNRFIQSDGFRVDAQVHSIVEGENLLTAAKSTGLGLIEIATVLDNLSPDIVVTIADRFETMSTAVAAAYMNLPLAHVQGGEITGSIDEKVRHAITKLADIHLVSSEPAADRVRRLGERTESIHVTGCPSIDLAGEVVDRESLPFCPIEKYGGVGSEFDYRDGYVVVLQHPVTTEYDESLSNITKTLDAIDRLGKPTFWFWPNVDAGSDGTSAGIRRYREHYPLHNVRFFKHFDSVDFLHLLNHSRGIVGNSSVAIRECSYLGVPAVNIGSRQSGRDRGPNVIDVDYSCEAIHKAAARNFDAGRAEPSALYGSGNAGERIAGILATTPLRVEKRLEF